MPQVYVVCGTMGKVKKEKILFWGKLWLPPLNARTRVRLHKNMLKMMFCKRKFNVKTLKFDLWWWW